VFLSVECNQIIIGPPTYCNPREPLGKTGGANHDSIVMMIMNTLYTVQLIVLEMCFGAVAGICIV